MVETFAQVWFLCAIAFLAGSAVTWLLFVRGRPQRRASPLAATAPWVLDRSASTPRPERAAPEPPPAPAEPALANLDTHRREGPARHPGSSAAGALDRLGVADAGRRPNAPPPPPIPTQGGPVDEPAADESR